MSERENLVLIGNGMAGMRTVEELLALAPDRYRITVFGAEPYGNYNRILLSPVLAGEKKLEDILLNDLDWYAQRGITLHAGCEITGINRARRQVYAANGTEVPYDRLLLATGSLPVTLPLPGADLPGVVTFRNIVDVEQMLMVAGGGRRVVVIGGGLLGLEVANGLLCQGMQVSVVHLAETLMERQLDGSAAELLCRLLQKRGMQILLGACTEALLGEDRVAAVRLSGGRELPADLVVMAVGIRPHIGLARSAGLYCERGVVVNDTLQTYDPRIYAVGECVQHRGNTFGLVAPLFEQAKVCANHLAQIGYAHYPGSVTATRLKVTGVELFSAGDYLGAGGGDELVYQDPARGIYKKLVVRNDRVCGAVLYGDAVDASWYFQLMREETDVGAFRKWLLFGQAHLGDAGHGGANAVAAMDDAAEVCGCNGVSKGQIVRAITTKGLFTLEEVRVHTKASSSCGSCTGMVEQLLTLTLGGDYSAPEIKPLCGCTDSTHEDVRRAIRENALKSVPEVMRLLEWRNPDGCQNCRPALNYYLLCAWPGEYRDDAQSRFINERVHANIQRDGTYSVVPRIWGGVISPAQLHAIAEVAERFEVPSVKLTGGQRIDLLGVSKERLPAVWHALNQAGLVSGHAYGKAVRTVKTCVGSQWCRFGTQDSTTLGIRMEKLCWGAWTPHKVKMGVSGCPRNCSEATIKDLGVVGVDSGWEIHVGGSAGVKVRATELLCRVKTMDEVLEYCGAFLQLYREEARYLERTAPWIERVGLAYVRRRLVEEADDRRALHARFLESQRHAQEDPWAERAEGSDAAHKFQPLAQIG